jgi:origin recognition complex subunit 5
MGSMQLGPSPFALDRMLAIFTNIVDENVEMTVNVHQQVASLISQKVLLRCSNSIDKSFDTGIRLKCNVKYDMIKSLAKTVHFEVHRYLYEQQ